MTPKVKGFLNIPIGSIFVRSFRIQWMHGGDAIMEGKMKRMPGKALAYLFAMGLEEQMCELSRPYYYVKDNAYYKAVDALTEIEENRVQNLLPIMDKAVHELSWMEPFLTNRDIGETEFRFKADRITKDKTDGRELELVSDYDEIGFCFSPSFPAIIRPALFDSNGVVDFGSAWCGIPCSYQYREAMSAISDIVFSKEGIAWNDAFPDDSKFELVYEPVLRAFTHELFNYCQDKRRTIEFIRAFFGDKDYYIVSLNEEYRFMHFARVNPNTGGEAEFPTKLMHIDMSRGFGDKPMPTTLNCTFNNGWKLRLRLHPTTSKVLPSAIRLEANFAESMPYGMMHKDVTW